MSNGPPIHLPFFTDSYKITHHKQYPPDSQKVYSYLECREGAMFPETMFFGLQAMLKAYLEGPVVNQFSIDYAASMAAEHFVNGGLFNREGWQYILNEHGGCLPVEIKAVPEGMVVPNRNVLMSIVNTDEKVPWLTNWIETFLVQVWYPCTVATLSREVRKIILKYLEMTGNPSLIDFKLHDFGYRGSTSIESAGIGGMAHLVNFKGTDTLRGVEYAQWFYGEPMAGFSIPAAEHSTMTSWGGPAHERDAFANMLKQFPSGLVAVVSDSYDIFHAIRELWGRDLKDQVMERDGVLVIRPDSGDPAQTVLKCCELIWDQFGGTVNDKGYMVFDSHVRLIQGDGIGWYRQRPPSGDRDDRHTIEDILKIMQERGFSADNIAFGSGGGLLQQLDRDTQRFAFKCSAIKKKNQWWTVWKDPITQKGKGSKKGRLKLVNAEDVPVDVRLWSGHPTDQYCTLETTSKYGTDIMQTVFKNGELVVSQSFEEIRQRGMYGVSLQLT
jgi:nicotinamide phosphoribosyltransferase